MIIFKLPKINRITAIYFISLFFLYRFVSLPDIFYIVTIICYIFIPAYGSMMICSNFYVNAICSISDKTGIVLTFNLIDSEIDIRKLLDLLEISNVKAMFFITGEYAKENPDLVKQINHFGHSIGNQYMNNSDHFGFHLPSRLMLNMEETSKLIMNNTGKNLKYFRPPFGITNPFVKKAIKKLDFNVVGWKIKISNKKLGNDGFSNKIIQKIKGGEIILIELSDSEDFDGIQILISEIKKRNISFRLLD